MNDESSEEDDADGAPSASLALSSGVDAQMVRRRMRYWALTFPPSLLPAVEKAPWAIDGPGAETARSAAWADRADRAARAHAKTIVGLHRSRRRPGIVAMGTKRERKLEKKCHLAGAQVFTFFFYTGRHATYGLL